MTEPGFIIFFILLLSVLAIVKSRKLKKTIILIASYYFYSCWDYRFLALIIFSTLSGYFIGKLIESDRTLTVKKLLLFISVFINLSMLGFFRYYNFFVSSISEIFPATNMGMNAINLIVPLGVSFYTFRLISYSVDIYRGSIAACRNIFDFALYVSFFPVIISGPITRASNFIPQLNSFSISRSNLYAGFRLFIIGLFLKIVIADRLTSYVNYYFSNYDVFSTITAWLAVLSYSLQIYYDFAGYSNMAIGLALMMGFKIEANFNFPYLATSVSDFWKRWHITLSTWIKDYIYIPLGGSRKGKRRVYINLLMTMTLCGLWHGAALTFILWGFCHGLFLVIHHAWRSSSNNARRSLSPSIACLFTFIVITLGWVLFRSDNLFQALAIFNNLFSIKGGITWYQPFVVFVLLLSFAAHLLYNLNFRFFTLPLNTKYTTVVLFCLMWIIIVFYPKEFQPFVYLQF
ncbi:MAG: MBOAT family protein [Nitrospirae bacterium]|nr:MBOAT family protein [Nitrospirota bacterium]